VNFSRIKSKNTLSLKQFMQNEDLMSCDDHVLSDVKYTHENEANRTRSCLDHFLVIPNLYGCITKYESVNKGDNLSDHMPVCCYIDFQAIHNNPCENHTKPRVNWGKISQDDILKYRQTLDEILSNIKLPMSALTCNNALCQKHKNDIDNLYNLICEACMVAGSSVCSTRKNRSVIPGWNELVLEHRERAIFWHSIWKSSRSFI
jgi:hypothetical protein